MLESYPELLYKIEKKLKSSLSKDRVLHIFGVCETACFIGENYNLDIKKLTLSALLHDIAKNLTLKQLLEYCVQHDIMLDSFELKSKGLLHGKVGSIIAKDNYHINDKDILNAISNHTTGKIGMSVYEEVIYIADYTEPSRNLMDSKDIIDIALNNISEGVLKVVSEKIIYVIKTEKTIHPRSIEVYNHYHSLVHGYLHLKG